MNTRIVAALPLVALLLAGTSAEAAKPGRRDKTPPPNSGFLTTYEHLQPAGDKKRPGLLTFVASDGLLATHGKVIIRPVQVWFHPDAGIVGVQPNALQEITDYFLHAVRGRLHEHVEVVDQPGPGVMEMRVALTELVSVKKKKKRALGFTPVGLVVGGAKRAAKGDVKAQVSVECELLDSLSGQQLAAMVERSIGGELFKRSDELTLEQVRWAIDRWVEALDFRLLQWK